MGFLAGEGRGAAHRALVLQAPLWAWFLGDKGASSLSVWRCLVQLHAVGFLAPATWRRTSGLLSKIIIPGLGRRRLYGLCDGEVLL